MIIMTNSKMLIKMSRPSELSFLYRNVHQITLSGSAICHQNPREIEYTPAPSRQLSTNAIAVGVPGNIWAMGVSQRIPDKR
jgi:hypothetical protein